MAIVAMTDAVAGNPASSAEYNKLIDNIQDLDARLGAVVASPSAHTRLNSLETLTTDTATNGGQGNSRLADRFGTGVGTGSNVTTGSASSQLTDLRSRATALEGVTTHVSSGNSALNTRVTALETATGTFPLVGVTRATDQTGIAGSTFTPISWSGVVNGRNTGGTMWTVGNATRLVVPSGQGGLYLITGIIVWNNTGTVGSLRSVSLRKNGSVTIRVAGGLPSTGTATFIECAFAAHVELVAGDYLEVMGWHNDSTAQTVRATDGTPNTTMRKIAA